MAFIVADRVQETATANTTVSFTLTGAITSYQSFSAIGNTNTTYYGATDGTNWEVGLGTYSTTGPTLTRTTILSSSNSGSAVTFSGAVTVWCDYPAGKQISSDYPNALGVVVPAAITGTNEVLRGTGQNLLLYSNTFNTGWSPENVTAATTVATTDPFGGSNAWTLTENSANGTHAVGTAKTLFLNSTYTLSVYAKANTRNWIYLSNFDTASRRAWFDLSTGVIGTTDAGVTAVITSVGNGWYRCSITTTVTSTSLYPYIYMSTGDAVVSYAGNGTSNLYLYGAQLDLASTPQAYVATTTAIVWNVPTLSFLNSSSIGLQSDGSLYVSPAGTGALQAQATTSTTAGGNARGAQSVDWQTVRSAASQVASAPVSVISGGNANSATAYASGVSAGVGNLSQGNYNFVGGGASNTANGSFGSTFSTVVGGYINTGNGYYNFVGGGFTNTGTSITAVTTQSGTMNATTAVTLSGSNASIKVGQYITGTSIAQGTYVAAISGTSLTLSQNASGSSTSTLSFYTPHGVVVGGGNNQATGSYSFIGGGGDAGTAANRNVASGPWSTVVGGRNNTASGDACFIGGGGVYPSINNIYPNSATGIACSIVGGLTNSASSEASFIGGGGNNIANANYSSIIGGNFGTTRSIRGNTVFPACQYPVAAAQGVSQAALVILGRQTTDATATVLCSDSSAASGTNQVILPNNSAYTFKGTLIANVTGGGDTSSWEFRGCIKRGANAAATSIVGTPKIDNIGYDAGATLWSFTLTADTTNGGLAVTVTGLASTTIRWVAKIETTEVTY